MNYSPENLAELHVLMIYKSASSLDGIKIHKDADQAVIDAAQRLFDDGFITQNDGGYLTAMGRQAADHAHSLYDMLNAYREV